MTGIGSSTLHDRQQRYIRGERHFQFLPKKGFYPQQYSECVGFIQTAIENMTDTHPSQPDKRYIQFARKKMLYKAMLVLNEKAVAEGAPFLSSKPSLRTFYRALQDFPNLIFRKHCRFTKCDTCCLLQSQKATALGRQEYEKFDKAFTMHCLWQMGQVSSGRDKYTENVYVMCLQRHIYYKMRELSRTNPAYLTLIMDAMDQDSSRLPSVGVHMKGLEEIKGRYRLQP